MLEIRFLRTNGWYDTETGNTICILLNRPGYGLILDAGNGRYKLDSVILLDKPFYLLLSHQHLDHVYGLHILNKFRFKYPLKIFAASGQKSFLKRFISEPYTIDYKELPYAVKLYELPEDRAELPFEVEASGLEHSVPTVAIRLELDSKIVACCADTGFCSNAVAAARPAREAGAKKLILVYFDASRYLTMEMREKALRQAQEIFSPVMAAKDGLSLPLLI